jgi:hypothetical protein
MRLGNTARGNTIGEISGRNDNEKVGLLAPKRLVLKTRIRHNNRWMDTITHRTKCLIYKIL